MLHTFRISVTILATALIAGTCAAQSFEKAKLVWTLPWDDEWVTTVQFVAPNMLVAGNKVGDILVWTLPAASEKAPLPSRRLAGHTNTINRLFVTPDQRWLISASNDHTIRIWDMQGTGSEAATVLLNPRVREEAVARKRKVPPPIEAKVQVQQAAKVLTGHNDWVVAMDLARDGSLLVSGDDKGEVIVWELPAAKEVRRWRVKGWAFALAISPDKQTVAISERLPLIFDSGRHMGLKLWNLNTGVVKTDLGKEFGKEQNVALAFSADGKWLAVGRGGEIDGMKGSLTLVDPATGKKVRELTPGHLNGLTDIAFHPDGKHVLSCGRDTVIKVWSLANGKLVKTLGQPRGGQFKDWLHGLSISNDGLWIAGADIAGQVQIWALPK